MPVNGVADADAEAEVLAIALPLLVPGLDESDIVSFGVCRLRERLGRSR